MPVHSYFTIINGNITEEQTTLIRGGPIISVEISIPTALSNLFQTNKIPIPQPVTGFALIDTGCMLTSVDVATVNRLGLKPVGVEEDVYTAQGRGKTNRYPAHVKFPGTNIEIDYNAVLTADLSGQHFNNTPIIALIGRDILADCVFIYNGKTGMYTFAY